MNRIHRTASSNFSDVVDDLVKSREWLRLAVLMGWRDVINRYRRSTLGPFWVTINTAVLIGTLYMVFGVIFGAKDGSYLLSLTGGLIIWGFMAQTINEGCEALTGAAGPIKQMPIPLFVFVIRTIVRNIIMLAHSLVIFPVVFIVNGASPSWEMLLFIPGFLLVAANAVWAVLLCAMIHARFRDFLQVMTNILQMLFFLTPIFWEYSVLKGNDFAITLVKLNPFFHLMEITRGPLLGGTGNMGSWLFAIALLVVGTIVALYAFSRCKSRISFWL